MRNARPSASVSAHAPPRSRSQPRSDGRFRHHRTDLLADEADFQRAVTADLPVDLVDRAVHQQLAAFDDADRRAAIGKLREDMAGDQNRLTHRAQLFKQRFHFEACPWVEAA